MLAKQILREIMNEQGIGIVKMAEMCGIESARRVSDRLGTSKSITIGSDILDQMLRVLGYKLVAVPVNVKVKNGWYEIDDSLNDTVRPARELKKYEERKPAGDGTPGEADTEEGAGDEVPENPGKIKKGGEVCG